MVITVDTLTEAEDEWCPAARRDIPIPAGRWGLEPYPMPDFARLLKAALAVEGLPQTPVFCDIGAGIGAKVLLAEAAGCTAWGVEAIPEYCAEAVRLGAQVVQADAEQLEYTGVNIAFVNCPYRDLTAERAFEDLIRRKLPPGCVLISVNHAAPPAGWQAVTEDPARDRGIWIKPREG